MSSGDRPVVLVLEDEWIIADQVTDGLRAEGFEVAGPASRVEQAFAIQATRHIDFAVLDINVYGETSFRFAEFLAQQGVPFLFLSGYSEAEIPNSLVGGVLYQKPVSIDLLVRGIRAALGKPT